MTFQDVDDFKRVGFVPKEDDVAPKGEAAYVGPQFGPSAAERAGQRRQFDALPLQTIDECTRYGPIPALLGEVSKDVPEVLPCRG
jgi:hypothetical protein